MRALRSRPWDDHVEWIGIDTTPSGYTSTDSGLLVPRQIERRRPVALDLFCGCGGMSLGLECAGVDVVGALEWSVDAFMTYVVNLGSPLGGRVTYSDGKREELQRRFAAERRKAGLVVDSPLPGDPLWWGWNRTNLLDYMGRRRDDVGGCRGFFLGDVRAASGEALLDIAQVDAFDLIVGGPPCQGLSTANSKACVSDPRNAMLWEFLRLVEELRPKHFVIENVPQLLTAGRGGLFSALRDRAVGAGYSVVANVLDAADYGVPQRRRRAFVIGSDSERISRAITFPAPTTWAIGMEPGGKAWDMRSGRDVEARGDVRFDEERGEFVEELVEEDDGQECLFEDA